MPFINGYSLYIGSNRGRWIGRLYRDSNDEHLHSTEDADGLSTVMREAERAILDDTVQLERERQKGRVT